MNLPRGTITALATPFRNGRINSKAYEADIIRQIESGIDGIIACGTTSEAPTLDSDERDLLIRTAVVCCDGRIPVIAGTGSNSTSETVIATRHAAKLGADAALVVTPYYNRPSQEGLFRHFEAVAAAVDIPIVLYNVPSRTGVDLSIETTARLARIGGITGIKDASDDPQRCRSLRANVPHDFRIYSGDDAMTLASILSGADGSMSVLANAYPLHWQMMCAAALSGNEIEARHLYGRFADLIDAVAFESNPSPVKYLMSLTHAGHSNEVRLPLVPICADTAARIRRCADEIRCRLEADTVRNADWPSAILNNRTGTDR